MRSLEAENRVPIHYAWRIWSLRRQRCCSDSRVLLWYHRDVEETYLELPSLDLCACAAKLSSVSLSQLILTINSTPRYHLISQAPMLTKIPRSYNSNLCRKIIIRWVLNAFTQSRKLFPFPIFHRPPIFTTYEVNCHLILYVQRSHPYSNTWPLLFASNRF